MKFTWRSTLLSLATLNLSCHLSEALYLIKSHKKKHIQRNFLFRLHFSSDLSYDDVAGPNQHPSRTSLTWSCQRGTSGLSCCCCCCSQTWGPQIWKLCQTGFVEYPSGKEVSGSLCIWLDNLYCFVFFKRGHCFPCVLSKLQDLRNSVKLQKNNSEMRDSLLFCYYKLLFCKTIPIEKQV